MVYFCHFLLSGLRVNYPVNTENDFLYVLVVIYVQINVKPLIFLCNICTKVCNLIKNYSHHGKSSYIRRLEMVIYFVDKKLLLLYQ